MKRDKQTDYFFLLWKLFGQLYNQLLIPIDSNDGKKLVLAFSTIGRKKYKSRGKLFVVTKEKSTYISDLVFEKGKTIYTIPFHLLCILKDYFRDNQEQYKHIYILIEKIVKTAYKISQKHNSIILIVYKKMLNKYHNIYQIKDDLFIEGFLGLIYAIYKFNPEFKTNFETYAYYWCWKYMFSYTKEFLFKNNKVLQFDDKLQYLKGKI